MTDWYKIWQQDTLSFHRDSYHPQLLKYWQKCKDSSPISTNPKPHTVLLPFCGKSLDILWLSTQGHHVFGIEMVESAIHSFFNENNLVYNKTTLTKSNQSFPLWSANNITLCQADMFSLPPDISNATSFYDRAALIALPINQQKCYVKKLLQLAPNLTFGLLITMTFSPSTGSEPPFSTSVDQVYHLFENQFHIQCLSQEKIPGPRKFQKQGISKVKEYVYLLRIK